MSRQVEFYRDDEAIAHILKNNKALISMQSDIAYRIKSTVEAQFFQQFGVQGRFIVKIEDLTARKRVAIIGEDKNTKNILYKNPGWLDTFIDGLVI